MFNMTELRCCDKENNGYYLAGAVALLTIASEMMPLIKKIPYNGLLHIFTSKCFKKKLPAPRPPTPPLPKV